METKEEYVVFGYKAEINSTYHYYLEKGGKSDKYGWSWRGYIPYAHDNMFPTREAALAYASEVAGKTSSAFYGRPIVVESDCNAYRRIAWGEGYKGRRLIFVVRVPTSYYIGEVWAATLAEVGNCKYTDDKPCQVYRDGYEDLKPHRLYLRREHDRADEWVRDKWQGSFFAPKDAKSIADQFCGSAHGKNGFHAWVSTELLRPEEGRDPRFGKGDEVYTLSAECWAHSLCRKGRKHIVTDIKVERDADGNKRFVYKVDGNGDFLPVDALLTKGRIVAEGGRFYRGRFNGGYEDMLDYHGHTYTAF